MKGRIRPSSDANNTAVWDQGNKWATVKYKIAITQDQREVPDEADEFAYSNQSGMLYLLVLARETRANGIDVMTGTETQMEREILTERKYLKAVVTERATTA